MGYSVRRGVDGWKDHRRHFEVELFRIWHEFNRPEGLVLSGRFHDEGSIVKEAALDGALQPDIGDLAERDHADPAGDEALEVHQALLGDDEELDRPGDHLPDEAAEQEQPGEPDDGHRRAGAEPLAEESGDDQAAEHLPDVAQQAGGMAAHREHPLLVGHQILTEPTGAKVAHDHHVVEAHVARISRKRLPRYSANSTNLVCNMRSW